MQALPEGGEVPENPGDAVVCGGQDLVSDTWQQLDREDEFTRLVLCRRARMLRSIWRVLRNADLAEDALQDALATLWRKLPVLARHPNPDALVLRVSLNAALDHLRVHARRRRRDVSLDSADGIALPAPAAGYDPAVLDEVRFAISRLPRRQATAILLRAIHDESYETIARTLECSEITARGHVLRARENLRRMLPHLCKTSPQEVSP